MHRYLVNTRKKQVDVVDECCSIEKLKKIRRANVDLHKLGCEEMILHRSLVKRFNILHSS